MSTGRRGLKVARTIVRRCGAGVAIVAILAAAMAVMPAVAEDAIVGSRSVAGAGKGTPAKRLGGVWKLDEKRSEALKDRLPQRPDGGPPGGGMRGGPPGGGIGGGRPGGGMRGGPPDGADPSKNSAMKELANPPLVMLVEDLDSLFIVSERGVTRQVLVLGDMALAASTYPDAPHVAAKWTGGKLVSEAAAPRGGAFRTEYRLSGDGTTLTVKLALDGPEGRPGIDLERVYVRYEGDD